MPVIVLVHGIDQQLRHPDELKREWLPAIAAGVARAGHPSLANRIWHNEVRPGDLECRMAFYGDLFLCPGQQGIDAELAVGVEPFAASLAQEWLQRAAVRASQPKTKQAAVRELEYLSGGTGEEAQGTGAVVRSIVSGLSRLRFFAPYGMAFAQRFVNRALSQVSRYLADESIRAAAQQRIRELLDSETKIVLAHSLGSVVAFEALHALSHPLPLLVTLGSPLGLQTIIYQKLRPQPPCFPSAVRRWVNVSDKEDFIAAEPNLTSLFGAGIPTEAVFEGGWTANNGARPHDALFYLEQAEIGRPVAAVLGDI